MRSIDAKIYTVTSLFTIASLLAGCHGGSPSTQGAFAIDSGSNQLRSQPYCDGLPIGNFERGTLDNNPEYVDQILECLGNGIEVEAIIDLPSDCIPKKGTCVSTRVTLLSPEGQFSFNEAGHEIIEIEDVVTGKRTQISRRTLETNITGFSVEEIEPESGWALSTGSEYNDQNTESATGEDGLYETVKKNSDWDFSLSVLEGFGEESVPYRDLIYNVAEKYNLPAGLLAAIIKNESNFTPDARSYSEACGLAQVVSKENKMVNPDNGQRYFKDRPSCEKLFDPEFNLDYAFGRILKPNLKRYQGNIELAVKDYGPIDQRGWYFDQVIKVWEESDRVGYLLYYVQTGGILPGLDK